MPPASRRYRRGGATRDDTVDFAQLSGAAQLEALHALVDGARTTTYEAIGMHTSDAPSARVYGTDPLDAVATANEKFEAAREQQRGDAAADAQLDAIGCALRAVVRLAKAHANLRDTDEQLQHGDVAVAASAVAEAATLLAELQADADAPRLVARAPVDALHTLLVKKRAALRAELEYVAAETYRVSAHGPTADVAVAYSVAANADGVPYENPVTPSDLFFALAELGLARARVDALADALVARCFVPLLRSPADPVAVARTKIGATISFGAFVGPRAEPAAADPDLRCALVRDKWAIVVDFVQRDVFHDVDVTDDHADVYAYLGARLWTALCPLLREALLVPLVPDAAAAAVADTHRLVPLLELEEKWLAAGLIAPDALHIKAAVADLLHAYVAKRRRDLLTTVASVLAIDDTNTVVVGGPGDMPLLDTSSKSATHKKPAKKTAADASLAFPRCSVSARAQTLVDFARETIALTVAQDSPSDEGAPSTAALYFYAVRDAFCLYRCLTPPPASDDPKRAFVLFNDCEFISHHLATLGLRYRDKWPPALQASATLVDVVASYRALAKTSIGPVLARTKDRIRHALGSWTRADWMLADIVDDQALLDAAENSLALAAGIVTHIAAVAAAHLPDSMHLRVLGLLVGPIAEAVTRRISQAASVSDSAARALLRLVSAVLALADCFRHSPDSAQSVEAKAPVSKYCPEWDALLAQIDRLKKLSAQIPTTTTTLGQKQP
ncbi:ribosome biogenesis protein ytm1 [Coemansia sp. RSA 1722]|nr:ribosome biogenesis protein ytm1 [Coemansia sp. RSA 485]KAJ2597985.1 ribosome biogenesis protein ytm1 [Coemansia sp. RSA 1722]